MPTDMMIWGSGDAEPRPALPAAPRRLVFGDEYGAVDVDASGRTCDQIRVRGTGFGNDVDALEHR